MSTEAKSLSVMEGIPTSVIPYDEYNTLQKPKAIYYEIAFRDEPKGGNKNILSVPVDAAPPEVGKTMYYTTAVIDTKTGPITRIVWPISPQLIPRKVTEPVESPVKDAVTEPAPQESKPPTKEIPDSQPRRGVVVSITKIDKDTFTPKDGQPQYKYLVVMEDGAQGVMWTPEQEPPAKVGQDINYTFDKVYQDGSKRIAMAPLGAAVDKDTIILRIACMKAAVEYFSNSPNHPEKPMLAMTLQAEQWEQWIMRDAQ